jgi:primosomal protein N' (replication factor Y)
MYAQVLVFLPVKTKASPFLDYSVPEALIEIVQPGVLVVVPVRKQLLPGIVIACTDRLTAPYVLPVQSVLDPEPALSVMHINLARWIARETLSPLHKCVQMMLPPGLRPQAYQLLIPLVSAVPAGLPAAAETLLAYLIERGPRKNSQVKRALKTVDLRRARRYLQGRGFISVERLLRMPRINPRTEQLVRLSVPRENWEGKLTRLRRLDLYRAILEFLEREGKPVELDVVAAETGAPVNYVKTLEKRGLVSSSLKEIIRDPLSESVFTPDTPPVLIPDQAQVWEGIQALITPGASHANPILLLGVTGSGKTELYMRATAEMIAHGKQAIILVPEISLTPQTVHRFIVRFPGRVGLWHSAMSLGERYDTWRRIRDGDISIVVGARSALFSPFPNLGLIVMDEEEDTSYKQGRMPYHHTRETAIELARLSGALLIMGSATPTLESYNRALAGQYQLFRLPQRVMGHQQRLADWQRVLQLPGHRYRPVEQVPQAATISLPAVRIVDMRAELKAGNRSVFSRALAEAVDQALSRKEQVIFFLNRRGTATYVFCRDCGWTAVCPRCDIPLTLHAKSSVLVCHRCNYRKKSMQYCPECGSRHVRAFGLGTEGLQSRVAGHWPDARILRWDRDVARSHAAHEAIMGRFVMGRADILVGTQMVARGLDIPKVTVVGVISADTALKLPDFRAAERAFQLLSQVAGRSGRGLLGGQVIFQTYHPDHYAVQYAAVHDYEGFAHYELSFRQRAGYPPATRLARLVYSHINASKAHQVADHVAEQLRAMLKEERLPVSNLIGPAPAFYARVRGRYRWQILLRHPSPADFLRFLPLQADWLVDIDPIDIL